MKYLDPVVVGVGDDDVILGVDGHPGRLRELSLEDAEFSKLAMVDHLLPLDLRLGREDGLGHQLVGQVHDGLGGAVAELASHRRAAGESKLEIGEDVRLSLGK